MKNLKLMFALVVIALSMNTKLMAQPSSTVTFLSHPTDLIGCYNETNRVVGLVVSNENSINELSFQWYKDGVKVEAGVQVPFETNQAGLSFGNLMYSQSGVYTCAVWDPMQDNFDPDAPNFADAHISKPVTVYVVSKPNITRQPMNVSANTGETVFMDVEGTLYGELPPSYRTKVQWYAGNTALVDNDDFSGTNQSHITVRNAEKYYNAEVWCQLEGYCGVVNSATVTILPKPGVEITQDVTGELEVCAGDENTLSIMASATNGGDDANLMYQWYVGTTALVDGAGISGATTNELTWTVGAGTTAGIYCAVSYGEEGESTSSAMVDVIGNEAPVFTMNPENQDIEEGDELVLSAMTDDENATYTWFSSNSTDQLGEGSSLTLTGLMVEDSGEFYCVAANDCGETQSESATITITGTNIELSVKSANNYDFKLSPNPFQGNGNVQFNLPAAQNAKLVLNSATGFEIAVLANGYLPQGNQSVEFSANNYNLSAGVYYLTLITENGIATVKLVYVK